MKGDPDPLGKNFFPKKSLACRKIERGDPLVSPGMVCYAGNQEKPFWFSSLDQIVQFGAIIFCRTILVSSCGYKKRVTIIVAFHFMKRRLKTKDYFSAAFNRKHQCIKFFKIRFNNFNIEYLKSLPYMEIETQ